jgi:hypothetical protein
MSGFGTDIPFERENHLQTMSQILKTGNKNIFTACKNDIRPPSRTNTGDGTMMHEQGMGHMGMMQWHDMLTIEIWNKMSDEQKKTLMKRMVDAKILMKENWIKQFQFKIETMKMVKKMLDET